MAAVVVGLFLLGWHYGGNHVRAEWDHEKVAMQAVAAAAETKNRTLEQTYNNNLQKAQNEATIRTQKLQVAAAATARTVVSLRDQLNTTDRLMPTIAADACRSYAATTDTVISEMATAGAGLAAAADTATGDVETLMQAWPK